MDGVEIPQYFICPISLQIMKDPVTAVTGITYDRESIEKWLLTAAADGFSAVCPVTKQPLPTDQSDLTPNLMLRRLIQGWCAANAGNGVERIPTPKSVLVRKSLVVKLIRDVNSGDELLQIRGLQKLDELACLNEKTQKCMAEAGAPAAMVLFILERFKRGETPGVEEALKILRFTWNPAAGEENMKIVEDDFEFVQSILWVLNAGAVEDTAKIHAITILKNFIETVDSKLMERLTLDFFNEMVDILRKNKHPQAVKSAIHVLIGTSPAGGNRTKMIEAGAVVELIEVELGNPDKKTTELIFALLAQLCSCADGRHQFLEHAGGIAVVAKRLLRVSPATDDRALCIIESIARFSATREVVSEMLRVSAVSKLCMLLQADCSTYLKIKARAILRLHSSAWSNSPCIITNFIF